MLFRGKVISSYSEQGKQVYSDIAAYINLETRQPVALQDDQRVRLYTYKAPPSAILALPSNVDSLIQSRIKGLKQLTTLPVSPF